MKRSYLPFFTYSNNTYLFSYFQIFILFLLTHSKRIVQSLKLGFKCKITKLNTLVKQQSLNLIGGLKSFNLCFVFFSFWSLMSKYLEILDKIDNKVNAFNSLFPNIILDETCNFIGS